MKNQVRKDRERKKLGINKYVVTTGNSAESVKISFFLTCDLTMQRINQELFGEDITTDVISIPIQEEMPQKKNKTQQYIGEIIINRDEVLRNCKKYNVSYEEELARVVVHGVLHLMGYGDSDRTGKAEMKAIEDSVLRSVFENV